MPRRGRALDAVVSLVRRRGFRRLVGRDKDYLLELVVRMAVGEKFKSAPP